MSVYSECSYKYSNSDQSFNSCNNVATSKKSIFRENGNPIIRKRGRRFSQRSEDSVIKRSRRGSQCRTSIHSSSGSSSSEGETKRQKTEKQQCIGYQNFEEIQNWCRRSDESCSYDGRVGDDIDPVIDNSYMDTRFRSQCDDNNGSIINSIVTSEGVCSQEMHSSDNGNFIIQPKGI